MAAFPPVDMQIQSADPISLIRAVLKNVLASLQLTPALQNGRPNVDLHNRESVPQKLSSTKHKKKLSDVDR